MHALALRAPCSPEPRLLPSRAKEQLLRGALRPARLLSRSVWAAATGSAPGGLTGSGRVSVAFPAAGRPRAGPQRMQGLARTYLLVHRSRLLTASSHGGRGEQLRGLSVRTPTPPWGSALVTSPPARGPASHAGTSRLLGDTAGSPSGVRIRPPGGAGLLLPAPTGGAAADQDTRSSCAPLSGLLLGFLLPSPTLVPCLCHQFLFVSPYS